MVVGRASLSFPTPDGILDVDQILDTDPWKQIDNFVQHNFRQNLLDEFNERLKLNPTIAPSGKENRFLPFPLPFPRFLTRPLLINESRK